MNASAAGPRRVLVIYSFGRGVYPFGVVGASIQSEMAERSRVPVEFHEITLDTHGSPSRESTDAFLAYIRALYADREPDLIVPCGPPAALFALEHRTRLFPSKPMLLSCVEQRHLRRFNFDTNTIAISTMLNLPSVVENALQLWSGTTNIAVVLGNSSLELFWKGEMQREFARFTNRVGFTWLNELPVAGMLDRLAALPAHSVVFYASLLEDGAGVPFEHDRALPLIHAVSPAPIVGLFEEGLGLGLAGGTLINLHDQGCGAGEVGLRILEGEAPSTIPIPKMSVGRPIYDWRELQKWGVKESQLPPGSEVRFRELTFAQKYRWYIVAAVWICAVQAALILGLVRELRRRRRTERSLRESEERMKLAASAGDLGMWEWDLTSDKVWTAGRSVERIGPANGDGSDYSRFMRTVHPEDRDGVTLAVAEAIDGNGEYEHVHRRILPDGQIRWIAGRGRVEFDAHHKPLRLRGVGLDITSRVEAEERARESERRFVLIANSAPVFIWTSGPDKLCTFFNKRWLEFTGRTLEQELGDGWAEGVHPDDRAQCLKTYLEAFHARQEFTMEYRLRRHDGQFRWISDHGAPYYDEHKNFMGYIGSCVDVTGLKEAEAELQRARHELAHVSRVSTLGELAGSLAHELNQPLTAIVSNAQAAQRFLNGNGTQPAEVREILKDIAGQGRRAGDIIVRMRAMLRNDHDQMLPLDLNEVVAEVLRMMRSDLMVRRITVVTHLAPGLPTVKGDRVELQQVLLNLILNAGDAMSEVPERERRVTIETERVGGGGVQVSVSDTGPGFTAEVLARVFEPFHTTKPDGLGLGLPICRSIIGAHGGELVVTNSDARGAIVRFTLGALEEPSV